MNAIMCNYFYNTKKLTGKSTAGMFLVCLTRTPKASILKMHSTVNIAVNPQFRYLSTLLKSAL